jgi:homoserine dehydrogenase
MSTVPVYFLFLKKHRTMKIQKIGLFGFGCVGQGLYSVLHNTRGCRAEIRRIAVKHTGKLRTLPASMFTYEAADILEDPEIDTVVELIDDPVAAYDIARRTLLAGKNLITANKRMLAHHLDELTALADARGVSLLYEAAACGSIPIIRNLEEYYDNDFLDSMEGIFNGTCNYILTQMEESGLSFQEALEAAQKAGFAESDPTLDIDGYDALYKTVILALHGFGVHLESSSLLRFGIRTISARDMEIARENGCRIRLISRMEKRASGGLWVSVAPAWIPERDVLSTVRLETNVVQLRTAFADRQWMMGKGAGAHPTGSAVLSDISASGYGYRYEYKKKHQGDVPTLDLSARWWIYLAGPSDQMDAVAANLQAEGVAVRRHGHFLVVNLDGANHATRCRDWEIAGLFMAQLPEKIGEQLFLAKRTRSVAENVLSTSH